MKNLTNNRIGRDKGFTIVETLIAITVLMIAVAGPLAVASKGLNAALFSKNQSIASYLAQEALESIENKRSNNIDQGLSFDNGLTGCNDTSKCDTSNMFGISTCPSVGCTIYFNAAGDYVGLSGSDSGFKRYFTYTNFNANDGKVTVVVTWNEGNLPNSVSISSEITSTNL